MSRRAPIEVAGSGDRKAALSKEKMRFEVDTSISNKVRCESLQN